jgi:hypothetical protein
MAGQLQVGPVTTPGGGLSIKGSSNGLLARIGLLWAAVCPHGEHKGLSDPLP